ncbi:hypothetical protein [Clostridium estertheticum]|uniref:hypothetical protein n=1 Tax=Clostridium estertheticum TaxID=238834 RepID=UPI000AD5B40D|nr:hypothetical protein [Clostridium estertheticum]MBU3073728.1 hypothetical protein [Clostridium estertheticum]MBU3163821.1 hypothetical protein [Clostridium estertheticum]MBU3184207.1 hypothetical protein [Clostridium estertheticum]MBZ9615896.1 hypothetical protein [Clostridium estertheticum subsp. laramiense]MCB2341269.1 hypothetical protein [Clostridium estertheticum]
MAHNNNMYYNYDRYKVEKANELEMLQKHSYITSFEKSNEVIVKHPNNSEKTNDFV